MMCVLHRPLLEIARHADVVVRTENQARAVAFQPRTQRLDLRRSRILLRHQVVEAKHHQRVRIVEDTRVDRQLLTRLIDALVHGHRLPGQLADQLLETEQRQMEQFERTGDALQKEFG
jgi:hypothetical protein